ncbi:hypothetical protein VKT23_017517 [Stygiomarasmius scandens]|uniref:Uncharacterized protein n=1 Tax=Marasmiellus scandens TaxID=2682957 RepID=A0ABR1IUZ4_9AGAR
MAPPATHRSSTTVPPVNNWNAQNWLSRAGYLHERYERTLEFGSAAEKRADAEHFADHLANVPDPGIFRKEGDCVKALLEHKSFLENSTKAHNIGALYRIKNINDFLVAGGMVPAPEPVHDERREKRKRPVKSVKSKATVSDSEESDEESVIIVGGRTGTTDVEMGEAGLKASVHAPRDKKSERSKSSASSSRVQTRATTVCIPYEAVPGLDTTSREFIKANLYLQKAETSKRVRVTTGASNFTPMPAELERRVNDDSALQDLLKDSSMLPFLDFASIPAEVLHAIRNYLANEILSSRHQLFFALHQLRTLEGHYQEAVRECLARASINDDVPAAGTDSLTPSDKVQLQPQVESTQVGTSA